MQPTVGYTDITRAGKRVNGYIAYSENSGTIKDLTVR